LAGLKFVPDWVRRHSIQSYALALTLLIGAIALAPEILISVPAGHVGVLWLRFGGGTVVDRVLDEGMHIIAPWNSVTLYDVRIITDTRQYDALTVDGLPISIVISVRYRLNPPAVGYLHKLIGPNYLEDFITKEFSHEVNEYASSHSPEVFYSPVRIDFADVLLKTIREQFNSPSVDLSSTGRLAEGSYATLNESLVRIEDVLIGRITLPKPLEVAIEHKMEELQRLQEYEYRIASTAKEAQRKRIEAEGIRDYQAIVSPNITSNYLRLMGIEATKAFAASMNTKIIIAGGKDGLPVILNTADEPPAGKPALIAAPVTVAPAEADSK